MGLEFSKPKVVKQSTLIITSAEFPTESNANKVLWDIWKLKKDEIKQDGFIIKRQENGTWVVNYWHKIDPTTYEKVDNKGKWEVEFQQKYDKWNKVIEDYCCFMKSQTKT